MPFTIFVRERYCDHGNIPIVKADGMGAVVALLELLLPEPREPLINICVEVRCVRVCVWWWQWVSRLLREKILRVSTCTLHDVFESRQCGPSALWET